MAKREWFVRPDTKVLHLSDGITITVRHKLNVGLQRTMFERMSKEKADGKLQADPMKVGIAMVAAYLVDWTVPGFDGKVVPITELSEADLLDTLNELDPDALDEMRTKVEEHIDAVTATTEKEKNDRDGESVSSATLPSLEGVTGDTSGLQN